MTTIPNVTAGADVLESWGDTVADELNRTQNAVLTSDVSKTAITFSDITGLTLPVVAGKYYRVHAIIIWDQSSTSGGIRISANFPTGAYRAMNVFTGETSDTAQVIESHGAADGGSGVATAQVTTALFWIIQGRYSCTNSGTFALRYRANTTGTAKIQVGSSLQLIADS